MIIPNSVGRIDEIAEAIRGGDRFKAIELLESEAKRLADSANVIHEQYKKRLTQYFDAKFFLDSISDVRNKDAWLQARRDCGWKGEENV